MPALTWFLCLLLLTACMPRATGGPGPGESGPPSVRAAFSEQGVAWVSQGRACVARAPSYTPVCPKLPAAVDVAWNGGDAWAALPGLGLAVTLDRAARSVAVGRVVALSATRAYREDGSAVGYDGEGLPGVLGTPSRAVTGGDGADYVLLDGELLRLPGGVRLSSAGGSFLAATPEGARRFQVPTAVSGAGLYQLANGRLERLDATGRVVASLPHAAGVPGLVGTDLLTVTPGSAIQVYTTELSRVR